MGANDVQTITALTQVLATLTPVCTLAQQILSSPAPPTRDGVSTWQKCSVNMISLPKKTQTSTGGEEHQAQTWMRGGLEFFAMGTSSIKFSKCSSCV